MTPSFLIADCCLGCGGGGDIIFSERGGILQHALKEGK
jgi:hypothetical protein